MKGPRVAVIGPGAVGGTLAAFLDRAGTDVELIGRRPGRIYVDGAPFRSRAIPVRSHPSTTPAMAIFCVKSKDTKDAIKRMRRFIGPDTVVVSLQNGLTHRTTLLRAFGRARCVFGVCVLGAERTAPAKVLYHGGRGISIARLSANFSKADLAARLLGDAGLKVELADSEDRILWTKAAFNAATNPLGALTGATNGELVGVPALRELALQALAEAVSAARAAGHRIEYRPLAERMVAGLSSMPAQPNSMLQDLRAGRRTELDAIVKPLLNAARRKRIQTPLLESLYDFTKSLEKELA